jgi:chromosome partitioning protein
LIVLVGGEKGGTGKTTLALHLAVHRLRAGAQVLLIDTDRQGSAAAWCATRTEEGVSPRLPCVQLFGKTLGNDVRELARKYDEIVVDAGGRDSVELRASMTVAGVLCIPIQASQFDVWTLESMSELIEAASSLNPSLESLAVLNRASPNPAVREWLEAQEALADYPNIRQTKAVIRDRIAFRKAARQGKVVEELNDIDMKAQDEILALCTEIYHGRS